jgi:lauroyl/myristoyl acyltransferase
MIRRDGVCFEAEMMEISVDRSKDREADLFATTARIQAAFEALIRAHPGQWMWGHRRWER